MNRLRGGVNRLALACVGTLLAATGTVFTGAGILGRARIPFRWPPFADAAAWVNHGGPAQWRHADWSTPAAVTALGAALLLCLGWSAYQLRGNRVNVLPLVRDGVTLSGSALAETVERRTRSLPGVVQAQVYLLGTPDRLRLRVHVILAPGASPAEVLAHFSTRTLQEARSVTARRIDAEVHLRVRRHRPRRVR